MKTFAAVAALCATSVLASVPNPGSAWKKTLLLDDFTGSNGAAPNPSNWIMRTGTQDPGGAPQWGTGEVETYTNSPNNVKQINGNLQITPLKDSKGQWTSARVESKSAAFQAPGGGRMRVEARIAMPSVTSANGLGIWPAFWMLGNDFRQNVTNWPAVGEMDIMENVNGGQGVYNVLHCDKNPGGVCNESNGIGKQSSCSGSSCSGNWHTYAVIVDLQSSPQAINFMVDGVQTQSVTQNTLGTDMWKRTIQKGFFLIVNVGIGGGFPNGVAGQQTPTAATLSGRYMLVDYIAVWTT